MIWRGGRGGGGGGKGAYLVSAIPAKALYQAKKAARRPKPPPACCSDVAAPALPLALANSEHESMRKARSRVKNRRKNMMVDRSVQSSRMNVKMNQPARKKPSTEASSLASVYASSAWKPGVRRMAYESQKPPYDDSAVAPNVLPTAISLVARLAEKTQWYRNLSECMRARAKKQSRHT